MEMNVGFGGVSLIAPNKNSMFAHDEYIPNQHSVNTSSTLMIQQTSQKGTHIRIFFRRAKHETLSILSLYNKNHVDSRS